MNDIKNLNNLFELFKPTDIYFTKNDGKYIEFADSDGWTDGFIADLTNVNRDRMKAQATPVRVYSGEDMVGLIMPIRVDR